MNSFFSILNSLFFFPLVLYLALLGYAKLDPLCIKTQGLIKKGQKTPRRVSIHLQAGYLEVEHVSKISVLETGKNRVSNITGEHVTVVQGTQPGVSFLAAVTVIMITKALKPLFSIFTSKTLDLM